MDRIESGKTVEEAKQLLMKNLNLGEFDSVDFQVVQEPAKGFLGIGARDAEVKLIVKTDKIKMANHLISEMAKHLGFNPKFKLNTADESNQVKVEFEGDISNELFSRLGRSAKKWEFLVNCIINQKDREDYLKICFEHENIFKSSGPRRPRTDRKQSPKNTRSKSRDESFESQSEEAADTGESFNRRERKDSRERKGRSDRPRRNDRERSSRSNPRQGKQINPVREQFLITTARNMAKKAIDSQGSVKLNPMNSFERRIIHTELQEMENIVTKSEGEGDKRHVVIEFTG